MFLYLLYCESKKGKKKKGKENGQATLTYLKVDFTATRLCENTVFYLNEVETQKSKVDRIIEFQDKIEVSFEK